MLKNLKGTPGGYYAIEIRDFNGKCFTKSDYLIINLFWTKRTFSQWSLTEKSYVMIAGNLIMEITRRREEMEMNTLVAELADGAHLIRRLVNGISNDEARIRPDAESWSILEVVCHLYDEEREDFRQRLDIILHRPGEPWPPIDPQGWVTSRRYNERNLDEMLQAFLDERRTSLEWLRDLSPDWEAVYQAPFGQIKAGDIFASWVAHDGLHTRQLVELRRVRLEKLVHPYDIRYAGDW
jgi:hypothetical protein